MIQVVIYILLDVSLRMKDIHYKSYWIHTLRLTRSSLMSMFSNSEIFASVCKSGCVVFVHHLETVTGFFPN